MGERRVAVSSNCKYFEMVDLLLGSGNELSDAKYKELAGKLGINVGQFSKDLKDKDA